MSALAFCEQHAEVSLDLTVCPRIWAVGEVRDVVRRHLLGC